MNWMTKNENGVFTAMNYSSEWRGFIRGYGWEAWSKGWTSQWWDVTVGIRCAINKLKGRFFGCDGLAMIKE